MKLRLFSFLALLLGFFLPIVSVSADEEDTFSVQTCPDRYYSFIANVRTPETRDQTVQDFKLGYCQLSDIMALDEELEQLKDEFRSAAFDCKDTSSYEEEFERILMEQYFVRNVQGVRSDVINSVDADQLEALVDDELEAFRSRMVELFVNQEERVSESTLNNYFDGWTSKYEDSLVQYRRCDEGAWAEVGETVQDFTETMQELKDALKSLKEGFKTDDKKSIKDILLPDVEVNADQDMTEFGSALKDAWEYVKAKKWKNEAEVEDATQVDDLADSGIVSFEQAFLELNSSNFTYSLELASADRMARYEVLYGMGGSVASTNMQSIVIQMNAILTEMYTKDVPNITTAAAGVYDKQCN